MSFRKENLTLEQSLDRKCAQTCQFFKDLKKKILEQEERTTVDPDIKHFAAG